ncbi:MAG TPA: hypothetical protein VKE74_29620, partial [Gemmataceae bacterium]|nr:hypothetical protein [Gemmataceae bacterium]
SVPGSPQTDAEGFALYSHGHVVRRVATEEEFHDWQRYEVRGVSGHWMLFSAVPAAYFLGVYPRARAALAAGADGTGEESDRPAQPGRG